VIRSVDITGIIGEVSVKFPKASVIDRFFSGFRIIGQAPVACKPFPSKISSVGRRLSSLSINPASGQSGVELAARKINAAVCKPTVIAPASQPFGTVRTVRSRLLSGRNEGKRQRGLPAIPFFFLHTLKGKETLKDIALRGLSPR
jgi:hypothetical protein